MLLQSWSSTPGKINTGVIRIFPAAPKKWANASFTNLRAEGGYKVSATRKDNLTVGFSIIASKGGKVRIKDNFDGRKPKWNIKNVIKTGDVYEVSLVKGQKLSANF